MKSEDFRVGKRYIRKDRQVFEFIQDDSVSLAFGLFERVIDRSVKCLRYSDFISSVSDAKSEQGDNVMSEYRQGDIVVMNKDFLGLLYEGEQLTYISARNYDLSELQSINGNKHSVPNDSFCLRDLVEPTVGFEVDELIEVSNHEDFELTDEVFFIADICSLNSYGGITPIVVMTDAGCIRSYCYARKLQKYTIKYDCVPVEVSKEEFDQYESQRKRVQAAAKGGDS